MNKINTLLSIISTLAVIVLFVLYFQQGTTSTSNASPFTSSDTIGGNRNLKIAYINSDTLYQYYKYYNDILENYNKKREKAEIQLKSRATKLQTEMVSLQKRIQAGLMSQNEVKNKQQELLSKEKDIQIYQQTIMEGLMEEEKQMNTNLYEKVTSFLNDYNKNKGYNIIMGYARGSIVWYADKRLDITQEVVEGLNKLYEQENKQ